MSQNEVVIFDLETTGLNTLEDKILGCGYKKGAQSIVFDREATKENICNTLLKYDEVVAHNAKFDLQMAGNPQIVNIFDTMVAEWLLYPDQKKLSLKYLGEKYFQEKNPTFKELTNQYKPKGMKCSEATFDVIPQEIANKYAKKDIDLTYRLYLILKEKLKTSGMEELFYKLEMPFLKVLLEMEKNGIKLDKKVISSMTTEAENKLEKLKKDIKTYTKDINIDSPKQLSNFLYEELKLPKLSSNTAYSTSESVLKRILDKHPVVPLLLEYRKLIKFIRTYLYSLPNTVALDGRIHPSFRQVGTGTGRLSCDSPNLQNIPKGEDEGGLIRKAFVPEEGNLFIVGDYDQMELRMLAHISNDQEMINAFNSGVDIHTSTAQTILGKQEITDEERRQAKTVNFGIIYGQTASGLAKALETDYITARNFIYKYACTYSDAWTWRKMQMGAAEKKPVISTILGRKRDLNAVSGIADRLALNTPIQGSCADLVKVAMLRCVKELKKRGLKAKLVLQVHDELVFEVPKDEVEESRDIIQGCMESVNCLNDIQLNCLMKVSLDVRETWLKTEKK